MSRLDSSTATQARRGVCLAALVLGLALGAPGQASAGLWHGFTDVTKLLLGIPLMTAVTLTGVPSAALGEGVAASLGRATGGEGEPGYWDSTVSHLDQGWSWALLREHEHPLER